ncbi:hypothetical protein HanXRQr2_Chr09g0383301 [Helianthus annuus]|uniref:Uncharacterized protein n=1 Tax=Helianthus annuus TaxID=4232 RepID=A0A251TIX0_HELAN|nr:hypothetical protein HanXRQr2_Chr09g0383301 [Helianthus annuus]KAJ0892725.1 hypothetical protein HanPSC8_Chr09g0369381 [Helianthus annuus]
MTSLHGLSKNKRDFAFYVYAEKEAQSMHIKRLLEAEWSISLPFVCPFAFVIKEITAQVPNMRF